MGFFSLGISFALLNTVVKEPDVKEPFMIVVKKGACLVRWSGALW